MVLNSGFAVIISSPSGAGKTTVTKRLLKKVKKSHLSVSCTTRKPRTGEKDGKDYFFISKSKFISLKKKNSFLETATVHGNLYGTLKSEVYTNLKKNNIVFLDVDWQGARLIRNKIKDNIFSIFLLPPTLATLKKRLLKRHNDNRDLAIKRFSHARKDIKHWLEYDYVLVNDKVENCFKEIKKIISNHLKKKN